MPPKFQSSFIPKGPITSNVNMASSMRRTGGGNLVSTIAHFIFIASVLLAVGVFGYRFYLEYRIREMESDLSQAQAALDTEAIGELTSLNSRIMVTKALVSKHQVITPLFRFLESSTIASVRFTNLNYSAEKDGLTINLIGEARGYSSLALQSQVFNSSRYFTNVVFSDISLNERGGVKFLFKAHVDPELLSYIPTPSSAVETGSFSAPLGSVFASSTASSTLELQ